MDFDNPTYQISRWLRSDDNHFHDAWGIAVTRDQQALERWVRGVLDTAPEPTTPWHVRRNLSEEELASVDWSAVANDLLDT